MKEDTAEAVYADERDLHPEEDEQHDTHAGRCQSGIELQEFADF